MTTEATEILIELESASELREALASATDQADRLVALLIGKSVDHGNTQSATARAAKITQSRVSQIIKENVNG